MLARYSEIRTDAKASDPEGDPHGLRDVDWITKGHVNALLDMGQGQPDDGGRNINFEGKVSAKKIMAANLLSRQRSGLGVDQGNGSVGGDKDQEGTNLATPYEMTQAGEAMAKVIMHAKLEGRGKSFLVTERGKGGGRRPSYSSARSRRNSDATADFEGQSGVTFVSRQSSRFLDHIVQSPVPTQPFEEANDGCVSPWSERDEDEELSGGAGDRPTLHPTSRQGLEGMVPGDVTGTTRKRGVNADVDSD